MAAPSRDAEDAFDRPPGAADHPGPQHEGDEEREDAKQHRLAVLQRQPEHTEHQPQGQFTGEEVDVEGHSRLRKSRCEAA